MSAELPSYTKADGALLIRAGACLLGFSLLNGFAIEAIHLPRLALSAHLVGLMGAVFLVGLGAAWPQLSFGPRSSRVACLLAIYGFAAGWLIYLAAAITGAAGLFPMAGGGARGSEPIEMLMSVALLTVALALFALVILVFRNARKRATKTGLVIALCTTAADRGVGINGGCRENRHAERFENGKPPSRTFRSVMVRRPLHAAASHCTGRTYSDFRRLIVSRLQDRIDLARAPRRESASGRTM